LGGKGKKNGTSQGVITNPNRKKKEGKKKKGETRRKFRKIMRQTEKRGRGGPITTVLITGKQRIKPEAGVRKPMPELTTAMTTLA